MLRSSLVLDYFVWHYTLGFRTLTANWLNGMWFLLHFFSITLLLRTLFAPWKRMRDSTHFASANELFEIVVFNILSRLFGALVRLAIIMTGLVLLSLGIVVYGGLIVVWCALPALLIGSCIYGATLLMP